MIPKNKSPNEHHTKQNTAEQDGDGDETIEIGHKEYNRNDTYKNKWILREIRKTSHN